MLLYFISSHSVLFILRCFLSPRSQWSLICPSSFHLKNTKRLEITRQQHLYTPVARFSSTSNAISPKLSAELRPPNPTISNNGLTTKAGRGQVHREFNGMKEVVAGD